MAYGVWSDRVTAYGKWHMVYGSDKEGEVGRGK